MTVKINKLEIENVKRVKAVTIEPTSNGLTILGGNNNQGKQVSSMPLLGHWVATSTNQANQLVTIHESTNA